MPIKHVAVQILLAATLLASLPVAHGQEQFVFGMGPLRAGMSLSEASRAMAAQAYTVRTLSTRGLQTELTDSATQQLVQVVLQFTEDASPRLSDVKFRTTGAGAVAQHQHWRRFAASSYGAAKVRGESGNSITEWFCHSSRVMLTITLEGPSAEIAYSTSPQASRICRSAPDSRAVAAAYGDRLVQQAQVPAATPTLPRPTSDAHAASPSAASLQAMVRCESLANMSWDRQRRDMSRSVEFDNLRHELAIPACRRALETNPDSPNMAVNLGVALEKAGQLEESFRHYLQAAGRGYVAGQRLAGWGYAFGRGVAKNANLAHPLLLAAAQGGDSLSMGLVGDGFWFGVGVPVHQGVALQWYRKGAEANDGNSLGKLAARYWEGGLLIMQSYSNSLKYAERGAELQDPLSMFMLARHYETGLARPRDLNAARLWMSRAADGGMPEAREYLGRIGTSSAPSSGPRADPRMGNMCQLGRSADGGILTGSLDASGQCRP